MTQPDYPPDIIETLLATGKDVVQPHCVIDFGGPTFDKNAWATGERHMDELRDQDLVRLDAVGGTMLLVKADLHRDGLVFPPFPYGAPNERVRKGRMGEIETEGLGILAADMGIECWGLPNLEILHRRKTPEERLELEADYEERFLNPYVAADRGLVDAVIDPVDTRREVASAIELLATKRESLVSRKHDNSPL